MRITDEQAGQDLLGSVVPPTTFQWRLAERKARLTAGVISKIRKLSSGLWREARLSEQASPAAEQGR